MEQWVKVTYPEAREVFIDNQSAGFTNTKLIVGEGHHVFRLGGPANYRPPSVEKNVVDTAEEFPMEIDDFHPVV
ncbi:MAG: hypothetical protein ACHQ9S_26245 [Candidatus Binatia bacterium]